METLVTLIQQLTHSNETLTELLRKMNERIDRLEAKVAELTPKTGPCYRCGRDGHWASSCYARTHMNGVELESEDEGYNSE
jgi:hypothetical protein